MKRAHRQMLMIAVGTFLAASYGHIALNPDNPPWLRMCGAVASAMSMAVVVREWQD